MNMESNDTFLCTDGMSVDEEEIYIEMQWWLEGVVHLLISVLGLVANSISMSVMLSKGKFIDIHFFFSFCLYTTTIQGEIF